jgi:signal transduction histidine kinase
MARLRLVFALLAAAVLAATALLAQRALRAAEVERAARHETLAARLTDEMELALSTFLRREEERPVGHYAFSYETDALEGGLARIRSPLSRLAADPEAPFVVGWFQVDAEGVHSPLLPRHGDPASGPPPDDDARAVATHVREIVERALDTPAEMKLAGRRMQEVVAGVLAEPPGSPRDLAARQKLAEAAAPAPEPSTGTGAGAPVPAPADVAKRESALDFDDGMTEPRRDEAPAERLAKSAQEPKEPAKEKRDKKQLEADGPASTYDDFLQSLNRGAQERQIRVRKTVSNEAEAPPSAAAPAPTTASPVVVAQKDSAPPLGAARRAPIEEAKRAEERPQSAAAAPPEPPRAPAAAAAAPRPITVDPFVGRRAGANLLLVRAVWSGDRGSRQGLVLDVDALTRWLHDRALGGASLPGARLSFVPGETFDEGTAGTTPFVSRHRFVEPFDAITVEVGLAPLGDGPGESAVLGLAALLVLAAFGGLFAVYRMVAVRLAFAQRRSNFAAAVSHELKTPLTAIRMYVEMLRDGLVPSEEKRREYYVTLGTETERLSRLIDNVLEFSRLERGTRQLETRSAPLAPVLDDVLALLRPHAARQGFEIALALERDLPPVRIERDALAQILFNLVENALKYARGATDKVVTVSAVEQDGRVTLAVSDRGPGVPERRLGKIFEPFYRGEDELTRETQGSGIGLALVKGLAERMGASVSARNLPNGGFSVALLLAAASPQAARRPARSQPKASESRGRVRVRPSRAAIGRRRSAPARRRRRRGSGGRPAGVRRRSRRRGPPRGRPPRDRRARARRARAPRGRRRASGGPCRARRPRARPPRAATCALPRAALPRDRAGRATSAR